VLEHVPVVMYRDAPFGIVVYSVGLVHASRIREISFSM
jgi:hypothetical protein